MKRISALLFFIAIVFAGCNKETITPNDVRLDHYIQSFESTGQNSPAQVRVDYQYDASGRLQRITQTSYNQTSGNFEEQRYSVFSFVNDRVDNIRVYLTGNSSAYAVYSYQYNVDGAVSRISENNSGTQLTSEANFVYASDKSVKVY